MLYKLYTLLWITFHVSGSDLLGATRKPRVHSYINVLPSESISKKPAAATAAAQQHAYYIVHIVLSDLLPHAIAHAQKLQPHSIQKARHFCGCRCGFPLFSFFSTSKESLLRSSSSFQWHLTCTLMVEILRWFSVTANYLTAQCFKFHSRKRKRQFRLADSPTDTRQLINNSNALRAIAAIRIHLPSVTKSHIGPIPPPIMF